MSRLGLPGSAASDGSTSEFRYAGRVAQVANGLSPETRTGSPVAPGDVALAAERATTEPTTMWHPLAQRPTASQASARAARNVRSTSTSLLSIVGPKRTSCQV